ncbi:MAG: GNAT family N-acetyltransferase [Acidobacteria bacterium]|nr:GNAT family N-acetyltransferase [Acidobacteriota bacterium]
MRIRNYRPADLQTLYKIDQVCFPPGIAYPKSELMRFITERNSRTWVAESGDDIIGFLIASLEAEDTAHIVTIDVVASSRRKGVGKALMGAAEDWAREQRATVLYLETAEGNIAAQRFYRARGYLKVEKVVGYYSNGAAAWVMAKRLHDDS